ncbi:MAG: hypothetical protein SOX57_07400 [Schaalia hyovaginalis]|uniref:hypothetical protein n=1 Tax=Schaalia hyovaginalis TaxID=29316 RepID=UPI0026EEF17C|nr:hypothetical protein [Schaalia hyovaginalis]MCI7513469.1 hypothetical protein [Schaalia hyovaginalis]MDY3666341.1 hypothetical protein [Schaalia hyovaginalis]MDY4263140.1 hypothetical protein [Schaalia hyovaginalis]
MPDTPVLSSTEEMLETAKLQLADIHFDHLSIDLVGTDTPSDTDIDGSEDTPIEINCTLGTRQDGRLFGARFEFQIKASQWIAEISVITDYAGSQEFVLSPEAPADFASKVGLMAAFPYVREALGNLTARVTGTAVLLPLIRHGEIVFSPNQ